LSKGKKKVRLPRRKAKRGSRKGKFSYSTKRRKGSIRGKKRGKLKGRGKPGERKEPIIGTFRKARWPLWKSISEKKKKKKNKPGMLGLL